MFLFIVWQKKEKPLILSQAISQYSKNYQKLFRNISNLLEHNSNNGKSELSNFKDELTDIFRQDKIIIKKASLETTSCRDIKNKRKEKKEKKEEATTNSQTLGMTH